MTGSNSYRPRADQAAILDRGYALIESVPYTVTAQYTSQGAFAETEAREQEITRCFQELYAAFMGAS